MQPDKKPDRITDATTRESIGRLIIILLSCGFTVQPVESPWVDRQAYRLRSRS